MNKDEFLKKYQPLANGDGVALQWVDDYYAMLSHELKEQHEKVLETVSKNIQARIEKQNELNDNETN